MRFCILSSYSSSFPTSFPLSSRTVSHSFRPGIEWKAIFRVHYIAYSDKRMGQNSYPIVICGNVTSYPGLTSLGPISSQVVVSRNSMQGDRCDTGYMRSGQRLCFENHTWAGHRDPPYLHCAMFWYKYVIGMGWTDDGWRMISNIKIEGHHLFSAQLPKTIVVRLPKYSY